MSDSMTQVQIAVREFSTIMTGGVRVRVKRGVKYFGEPGKRVTNIFKRLLGLFFFYRKNARQYYGITPQSG